MAHHLVLVLIKDPENRVVEQVESLLERHSAYAKVQPYKRYFEPCHWNGRLWEEKDAEDFARLRHQLYGENHERDESGLYEWVDTNPDAHFDWYEIGGRWDGIFEQVWESHNQETCSVGGRVKGNICPVEALPREEYPGSLVTPDGQWHFFGWRFDGSAPEHDDIETIRRIVETHKGHFAVAVDVHS